MRLVAPVAHLLKEPGCYPTSYEIDRNLLTQLLFGEKVEVVDCQGEWSFVRSLEQQFFDEQMGWMGYPGWIESRHLGQEEFLLPNLIVTALWAKITDSFSVSFGTRLWGEPRPNGWMIPLPGGMQGFLSPQDAIAKSPQDPRAFLLYCAEKMRDTPYFWGGRSAYRDPSFGVMCGVDCSGYVQLLYRALGLDLPRDSKDQFRRGKQIQREEAKAGDLVFLRKEERIHHVMLYDGKDGVFEATIISGTIRKAPLAGFQEPIFCTYLL